jgi:RNA polymerase sigma factor (sigma-70 family)
LDEVMRRGGERDDGFEEAFRRLYPPARGVAYRILGSMTEAEEVAAEAMARALVRWPKVRDLPHRDAWVMRVTINLAIDVARRRRDLPADAVEVADPAEVAVLRVALLAALAGLTRRQREVIGLRYLADCSEQQVAEVLGIASSSVKEHTKRAMATLRGRYGSTIEEELVAN